MTALQEKALTARCQPGRWLRLTPDGAGPHEWIMYDGDCHAACGDALTAQGCRARGTARTFTAALLVAGIEYANLHEEGP